MCGAVPLFVLLCSLFGLSLAELQEVQFGPLDPDVTNPAHFWMPLENPIPEDYVNMPRFPVVPSFGAIAMKQLEEVYPNGTAKPSAGWYKNLWGFNWTDYTEWGAVYPYPYIIYPKAQNILLMYPGKPVNGNGNSRMESGVHQPLANRTPEINDAAIPYATMSAALDIGVLIYNGVKPKIKEITPLASTILYSDESGKEVAELYLVRGSPFVNIKCSGCQLGLGSKLQGVPPVIDVNGLGPGATVTGKKFMMQAAVGPTHPQGEFWHFYFDSPITFTLPNPPTQYANFSSAYTGLLQIACSDVDRVMEKWLDSIAGTAYPVGADISYAVDEQENKAVISFKWKKAGSGTLTMLAIPHHKQLLGDVKLTNTSYWSIKGYLSAYTADQWDLHLNLTTRGFGDEFKVKDAYKPLLLAQLDEEYRVAIAKCPGDGVNGNDIPGYKNMELYAYARDVDRYMHLAIICESVGRREQAANLTKHAFKCLRPLLERPKEAPKPCPPPINATRGTQCVRSMLDLYYDKKWGGLVTTWYDRFDSHYCECDLGCTTCCEGHNYCDNVDGWNAYSNYGNPMYNDHHFQYGYVVKSLAWVLYFQTVKGANVGLSAAEIKNVTTQALAFARDFANTDPKADKYFPYLRHKDLYDGHSWAEGYTYQGRLQIWNNQQSGGEAINAYYGLYLLGKALKNDQILNWGRIHLATEIQSLQHYQQLSNKTVEKAQVPLAEAANVTKCLSILKGNAFDGATYYGPNPLFECGIVVLPITPITREFVRKDWAEEAYEWMLWKVKRNGLCVYPNPTNQTKNPCAGEDPDDTFKNAYMCCPVMSPDSAVPEEGPPKCDLTHPGPPTDMSRESALVKLETGRVQTGVQYHICNQWRIYPDWFPFMYLIGGYSNPSKGWENLMAMDLHEPNPPVAPFPYYGKEGQIVGYHPSLSRATALFEIATNGQ